MMIAELGHYALVLALALALVQACVPMIGARKDDPVLMAVAGPTAVAQFCFVAIAFAALTMCYVRSDFSVVNVFENSHSAKPLIYKLSGVWGNHEGSMLLWVLILSMFGALVALFGANLPARLKANVLAVQSSIAVAFILFILVTSNPFLRIPDAPLEGRDLNPILQDPGLAIHPPLLYVGYVGLSISFSFAIAALIDGRIDAAWARWVRPWTLLAWMFLTLGIAMGSYWAYYTLGWGGWWFWDPVENASFMPWLAGTALLHSLAVTEKRGAFRSWTVLLAIVAFSLSLVGTFLVRSGVLTSVHAFATDPRRGVFILAFLALVVGGSLALFAWRAPRVGLGAGFSAISRESMLLANNVLLAVALAAVLLGTLYPLFLDALNLGKISVGPPYFDTVFVPLMAPAVFLMAIGPVAAWRQARLPDLWTRLRWALAVSVAAALVVPFMLGKATPLIAFGLWLSFWVMAATLTHVGQRLSTAAQATWGARIGAQSRSWYGMNVAHLGIAIFILGVTLVRGYEAERDLRMVPGDKVQLAGYEFTFKGTHDVPGPNYMSVTGDFEVRRGGSTWQLHPEKRAYQASGQVMTEAAIDTGLTRDIYVSLGEPVGNGAWGVRVYYKPFVDWIWGGCFVMALGGLLALSDRRYRPRRLEATAPAAAEGARA